MRHKQGGKLDSVKGSTRNKWNLSSLLRASCPAFVLIVSALNNNGSSTNSWPETSSQTRTMLLPPLLFRFLIIKPIFPADYIPASKYDVLKLSPAASSDSLTLSHSATVYSLTPPTTTPIPATQVCNQKMKRVAITGISGYVGSRLLWRLKRLWKLLTWFYLGTIISVPI